MSAVVVDFFDGIEVAFTEVGWFNATEVAREHNKRMQNWLDNQETQDYLVALCAFLNDSKGSQLKPSDLIVAKRGRYGGTWMHPDLAVFFGRWIAPRFGVWCDQKIKSILNGSASMTPLIRAEYLQTYHPLHDVIGVKAAESKNEHWVHANVNKRINKSVGLESGQRPAAGALTLSKLTLAQAVATEAFASANDHHDGYENFKAAMDRMDSALRLRQ